MSVVTPRVRKQQKPLRILMVTGVYPTQKVPHSGTFIKSQVDSLIAAGLEVEVIRPAPGFTPLRYLKATVQVFLKTLNRRFDIVHGHFGLWCLAARLQCTTPVVASFMGDDLFGRSTATGYTRKSLLVVRLSRWLSHYVDGVIVKSAGMRKVLDARVEVAIIPNGVDFTLFHPIARAEARAALGWDANRRYVLFGNNPAIHRKGFPLAQAAIACLAERGIEAELVVANGLSQTKLVYYINACNALILPSLAEGSPNIVKETMACNVPVVAADVGDVTDLIGRTQGCSVCDRTPQAFADGLERALLHTEPTTGRADIAHLECSLVAGQVIAVYQEVLARKRQQKGC